MLKTLAALAAASLMLGTARAEDFDSPTPITKNHDIVYGWQGHAYANPEGTRWSHCAISSFQVDKRKNDSVVMLKVHSSLKTSLTLSKEDWKITPDKTYKVSLQFDDHEAFEVTAIGAGKTSLRVLFDLDSTVNLMSAVAGARGLFVYRGKELLTGYNLTNSTRAVKWLDDCVGDGAAMNGEGTDFDAKPAVNPRTPKLDM